MLSWLTLRGCWCPHRLKPQDCDPRRRSLEWGGLLGTWPVQMLLSGPSLAAGVSWRIICFTLCLSWIERILSFPLLLCLFPVLFLKFCVCFSFLMELSTVFIYFIGFFPSKICLWVYDSITFLFQLLPVYFSNSFLLVFFCFKICFLAYHIKNQLYVHLFSPKYRYFKICFLNLYFVFNLILYFNHIP